MKAHKRYLFDQIINDLERKMVFMAGPRQVGKTTLAKGVMAQLTGEYLNWDIGADREKILQHELPDASFLIFDEIHKYRNWRGFIKDVYDSFHPDKQILVTGSARLDYYRFGGDSLQGRFHYLRLHPLSVAELKIDSNEDLLELFHLGGFPEPFFSSSEIESKRWSRQYRQRLIQEDLASLESVMDLARLELLMLRLPELVGSPLSINALREDLQVSHKAVSNWLDIFCRLYAIFRLPPFGSSLVRAVKKEQKHYHFDWTLIKDQGAAFENFIAVHLLKWVQHQQDTLGRELELRYFRDIDGREVDFIILEDKQPISAVEVKWDDGDVSKGLKYFKSKFSHCKCYQISAVGKKSYVSKEKIRVFSALEFLQELV